MQTKAAVIGLVGLVALGAVFAVTRKDSSPELPPPPADDAVGNTILSSPMSCPSSANAVVLQFDDEFTEASRAAVAEFEEKMRETEGAGGHSRLIQFLDLNEDGEEDFVTLYQGGQWCGSGGCMVDVFINRGGENYDARHAFLSSEGQAEVLESMHNGYHKVIEPVAGGLPAEHYLWQWENGKYIYTQRCIKNED